jgi:hypothetical protein
VSGHAIAWLECGGEWATLETRSCDCGESVGIGCDGALDSDRLVDFFVSEQNGNGVGRSDEVALGSV